MPGRTAILSLALSHFRSYAGISLETGGCSVALFGANGSGKTNILEALSLLSPGRGLRRAPAEELRRRPEELGWQIRAQLDTAGDIHAITTGTQGQDTRRSIRIDETSAPQTALGRLLRMVWLTPAMDRLWTGSPADRRRFLDRIALGFDPEHAEHALSYEKAMRARNQLLRTPPWDEAWLSGLEAQMAQAGANMAFARAQTIETLSQAQKASSTRSALLFPHADLAILGEMETRLGLAIRNHGGEQKALAAAKDNEKAALAARLRNMRHLDASAGRTLEGPHRSDLEASYACKAMPARSCSTGEQKALLISLCLANTRALSTQTGTTPIILLDEVAAHLDSNRRRALYDEIADLGAQTWVTGTGVELFEGLESTRYFLVREADGISTIEPA